MQIYFLQKNIKNIRIFRKVPLKNIPKRIYYGSESSAKVAKNNLIRISNRKIVILLRLRKRKRLKTIR